VAVGQKHVTNTVQPKNNALARSGVRSSCAARTRKPAQEVKVLCFCGLPASTFETQKVENLAARSRKKPQEVTNVTASRKKAQVLRVQPKKLVVLVLV